MFLTIVFFIILLGVLVLVHEWGHFIVARRLGVRVEEFAFGFPPRLASFKHKGTRYALNLFPLGGYVKIFGESGEAEGDPKSFSSRPVGQRFLILAAGVAMNLVLAWFVFSVGHGLGLPTALEEGETLVGARVTIIGVVAGSPAEAAGLQFGDAIVALKSQSADQRAKLNIERIEQVQEFIGAHSGEEIRMVVRRGETVLEKLVVPRPKPPEGQGPLGIVMARVGIIRSPWWRSPWDGLKTTALSVLAVTKALARAVSEVLSEGKVTAGLTGPVGIFVFAEETRRLGMTYVLELAGVISVNLALLNILPVPALDGGRILFLFLEKARGGVRVNQRLEQAAHTVGFALLLLLMAAITYRDIVRIL